MTTKAGKQINMESVFVTVVPRFERRLERFGEHKDEGWRQFVNEKGRDVTVNLSRVSRQPSLCTVATFMNCLHHRGALVFIHKPSKLRPVACVGRVEEPRLVLGRL